MSLIELGVNSYMTLEEVENLVKQLYASNTDEYKFWYSLSEQDKEVIILNGTSTFEALLFLGSRKDSAQPMQFPRINFHSDINMTDMLKKGIVELSITNAYKSTKTEIKLSALGVKSYSVEGSSISFQSDSQATTNNGITRELFLKYFTNYAY